MRHMIALFLIFCLLFSFSDAFSQLSRKNQFEIYAGAGFPLSPDYFKDYFKVGLSLNAQYVIFPSARLGIPIFIGYEGFTFNSDALNDEFRSELVGLDIYDNGNYLGTITDAGFEVDGKTNILKFGAGIRPYLTSPESATQFFLFGNVTYNIYSEKEELTGGSVTVDPAFGDPFDIPITQEDVVDFFGESEFEEKLNKLGIGIGAGIEIPAGSTINLIFQGMYNIIFTKDEEIGIDKNHSFIGATAGIVF
ncbi:MAG: hypothetical protein KAT07_06345 [Calditrichia bacterium]|nr:hypothetical protein [Calditrichia bacterium]